MVNPVVSIGNDWDGLLKDEWDKPYFHDLWSYIKEEYDSREIYPDFDDIFNALRFTAYADVKAVILGQDPYHTLGVGTHGLCFSVKRGAAIPGSLRNIFKELANEYPDPADFPPPSDGCLESWADRGVLLLNTVLTVRAGIGKEYANSHEGKGWEHFTDRIIKLLNDREGPVVFILWGEKAKVKKPLLTNRIDWDEFQNPAPIDESANAENSPPNLLLEASHPSPKSVRYSFFGCGHFRKTNCFLASNGIEPIDWRL
jgi:uracil-DNA glycosylase